MAPLPSPASDLVVTSTQDGVTTLRMNMPRRLNGWTAEMLAALQAALAHAKADPDTAAVILTGTDPYYSAGVNLGGAFQLQAPKAMRTSLAAANQQLFELFLHFDKPILAAVNGPAIGASVTTATLCNAIVASEEATFSTPFAAIGLPPEGCSSVLFARLMGEDAAHRMLGPEGWKPTAAEARDAGLVEQVVPHDQLLDEARRIAQGWVADGEPRRFKGGLSLPELEAINIRESAAVADGFQSATFLWGQVRFLSSRKKWGPAAMFFLLWLTRPAWRLLG